MAQPVDVEIGDKATIPRDRARDVEMDTIQTNSRYFTFLGKTSDAEGEEGRELVLSD